MVPVALANAGLEVDRIACVGIANQRETTIVWDRASGKPIYNALVWQDRRTADQCSALASRSDEVRRLTGLVIDPYFSATKIAWLLDNVPNARESAEDGLLAAGTVDSFLLWHLTGSKIHATDATNASRTMLMDLQTRQWSQTLCQIFGIPIQILPEILASSGILGESSGLSYLPDGIPISGVVGDQQGSLIGQGCVGPSQVKCTYGTGAFLLAHTGEKPLQSSHGLLTTLAALVGKSNPAYALEGSVFVAGAAVQWFRDGLKAIGAAPDIDRLYLEADPNSEVVFVPALTGLGAPHWSPEARGTIFGLTRSTSIADLAKATLEGVAFQVSDLLGAASADLGAPIKELRVDGGMSRSDPFLQFQADLLGVDVRRSPETESTALGAALLAGLGIGLWPDVDSAVALLKSGGKLFQPKASDPDRRRMLDRWKTAVESVKNHYASDLTSH